MVRIHFPQLGEGQYIEMRDPKHLKWKEQKEISRLFKEDDTDSQLTATEKLALMLIKGGYILDEENRPVHFPLNEHTVQELPAMVIEEVVQKFAELKGGDRKN